LYYLQRLQSNLLDGRLSKRANTLQLGCAERYTCRRVGESCTNTHLREWWNFGPIRIVLIITVCHVVYSDSIRSRTQGGIFTTPGDAYTTPVDMWVKALGELFFSSAELNAFKLFY